MDSQKKSNNKNRYSLEAGQSLDGQNTLDKTQETTAGDNTIFSQESANSDNEIPNEEFFDSQEADSNIHAGHRNRLRARYYKYGLSSFEPHEVLELLLCHFIPYRDVNGIAHKMIVRFGSLKNVLAASPSQLCEFDGIDNSTAQQIIFISSFYRYLDARKSTPQRLSTIADVTDYAYYLMGNNLSEMLYVVCMDNGGYVLGSRSFEDKIKTSVLVSVQRVAETAISFSAKQVFVVHSHPLGDCTPGIDDRNFTESLFRTLRHMGINLVEHLIIGQKANYSFYLRGDITKLVQSRN